MQTLEQRGAARPRGRIPARRHGARRAAQAQPAALTRPELAVLLAYAKLSLYSDLLDSKVPDDPYLGRELDRYFPKEMIGALSPTRCSSIGCGARSSRRSLTNSMINRGGATLIVRIADQTGASAAAIAAAFAAVRNSYDCSRSTSEIDALDNKIAGETQLALYAAVQDLLLDRLVWFLRNVDLEQGLETIIAHYRDGIAQVAAALDNALSKAAAAARDARAAPSSPRPACRRRWRAGSPACRSSKPRPTSCWSPTAPKSRSPR